MRFAKYLIASLFTISVVGVYGQTVDDINRLSFATRNNLTARVTSMGGAFTSLGADVASIDINPAGIGMYRSSEILFTPSLNFFRVKSTTNYDNNTYSESDNKTKFAVNNIAWVNNFHNSRTSAIRGVTFALALSTDARSSYVSSSRVDNSTTSIADYYASSLEGIEPNKIDNSGLSDSFSVYRNASSHLWGAMMAFNNMLLDAEKQSGNDYYNYYINENALPLGDKVNQSQLMKQTTVIRNSQMSLGFNIVDYLYIGMTLGVSDYSYTLSNIYDETATKQNVGSMDYLNNQQSNSVSGSAFDFKIGAIFEPITRLRIGIAFHSPRLYYMEDEYYADQYIYYLDGDNYSQSTPYDVINYQVRSAAKLLLGASYVLPYGIISVDYQRSWYGNSRILFEGVADSSFADENRLSYGASNDFMIGLEARPVEGFYIRGGYGYYDSAYKLTNETLGTTSLSLGLGLRGQFLGLDLAYVNSVEKAISYSYYDGAGSIITPKKIANHLLLTLSIKF